MMLRIILPPGPMTSRILSTGNLDGDDARRVRRHVVRECAERLGHLAEDVQAAGARLLERLGHDLRRDAGDLDVHLQRGDALRRAGDLEVHVAVVVLVAEDVGEDGVLAVFSSMMRPIAMPATGGLDRHAGVHQRQRAAADRRHRRGAVRLEDVGHDADRVGELVLARHHRRERALGERAVADLAAAGAAQRSGLADRERREVVVEHEALVVLAADVLDLLLVVGGAERAGDQRLRLAAREHDRAVDAREHAGLGPDRADLVELAAVEAHAAARAPRRASPSP